MQTEILKKYEGIIEETIKGDRIYPIEIMDDLIVAISSVQINKYDVYIYGANDDAYMFLRLLKNEGLNVKAVIDIDENKSGSLLGGVKIATPQQVKESLNGTGSFAFILCAAFQGIEMQDVIATLEQIGIERYMYVDRDMKREITQNAMGSAVDSERRKFYADHVDEILSSLSYFAHDECSLECLDRFLKSYCENYVYFENNSLSRYKYFYGLSEYPVGREIEQLYKHFDDEVWINCGSNNGDTIYSYFSNGLKCKKILAYEGAGDSYRRHKLKYNVNLLPESLRSKIQIMFEYIDENTNFDKVLNGDKVTFINADIEGAELDLLKVCSKLIASDRPVIAICAYHKASDIIELPNYINSIVDDYVFYYRKFASNPWAEKRNRELVLYAIPKERHEHKWINV